MACSTTPRKKVSEIVLSSCRCCNSDTKPQRRVELFGKKSSDEGIVDAIKQLTGLLITERDDLSHFVCRTCARVALNLQKQIESFKNICAATEKKQIETVSTTREKRLRRDDFEVPERSPLPTQPKKKTFIERRATQTLEKRFQNIAPKPGSSMTVETLRTSFSRQSYRVLQQRPQPQQMQQQPVHPQGMQPKPRRPQLLQHQPAQPQSCLDEAFEIISKSGLLGFRVRTEINNKKLQYYS